RRAARRWGGAAPSGRHCKSQPGGAQDHAGADFLEFGGALDRARQAQLESSADSDAEEGAGVERESALCLARVEPAVRVERQDLRVRFLVIVVTGLRRGVPAHRSHAVPAEDAGSVEETLRAEVAALAEGEETLVVLERERGEGGAEAKLSHRTRSERELGAAATGEPAVVEDAKPDLPPAFSVRVDRSDAAVQREIEPA